MGSNAVEVINPGGRILDCALSRRQPDFRRQPALPQHNSNDI
jgi:hypothetical protein